MNKTKKILIAIFTVSLAFFCLVSANAVKSAVSEGISRCLTVIIPSLYAMTAVSGLLIKSGVISSAGRYFEPVSRRIFGINGDLFTVFVFSQLSGYPIGAKMIYSQYTSNRLSKKEAEILSGLCFGSGGAFIFGCAALNPSAGRLILISSVLSNMILLLLFSPYFRRHSTALKTPKKISFSAEMLTDSITSAGRSVAEICFCILAFSVGTSILRQLGAIQIIANLSEFFGNITAERAEKVICTILDVTAINSLVSAGFTAVPAISALIALGGICVFLQISAVFKGKLSLLPLIFIRISAALISCILSRILLPFFMSEEVVETWSVSGHFCEGKSPIPSLLLVAMTVFLFAEEGKFRRKSR